MRGLIQAIGQVAAGRMDPEMPSALPEKISGHIVHIPLVGNEGGRARLAVAASQALFIEPSHLIRPRNVPSGQGVRGGSPIRQASPIRTSGLPYELPYEG